MFLSKWRQQRYRLIAPGNREALASFDGVD